MNINELKEKAVAIRSLYDQKNISEGKEATNVKSLVMQFISDLGDLSRYITMKERGDEIENFNQNTARELAECLAHVLVIADKYGINLEEAFIEEYERLNSELS